MGQLLKGRTLSWKETLNVANRMREAAVKQLILSYNKNKSEIKPLSSLKWGYEIEYLVLKIENGSIKPFACSHEILDFLNKNGNAGCWNPEYASFMVESVPSEPFYLENEKRNSIEIYSNENDSLGSAVQKEIEGQNSFLTSSLYKLYGPNIVSCTLGAFPLLGVEVLEDRCQYSRSNIFPTKFINEHPRFATLTRNIVERRSKPISFELPIFKDLNTKASIHLDAMGFGMGCCCLQTTTEMESFDEACRIYDELLVFAPIALALTASSPVFRGLLSAHDTRWKVLENAVDDRNPSDPNSLSSRYFPAKLYLSESNANFNDCEITIDQEIFNLLLKENIPESFARHYAHIFYRDPLIAYEGTCHDNPSENDTVFIDALQSTNWNSVRFKMPIPNTGFRIEFRPMEVQTNSFENCAFAILIEGLILALIKSKKNFINFSFIVPISETLENFEKAVLKDSIKEQKFNWSVKENDFKNNNKANIQLCFDLKDSEFLTINEIMNDKNTGILALIEKHAPEYFSENRKYFDFISKRASNEYETPAKKIRNLILKNPEYKKDSIVTDSMMMSILNELKSEKF